MKKTAWILALLLTLALAVPALADGVSQYVSGDYQGAETIFHTATVLAQNVTLRDAASYNGKSLTSIPNGAVVDVVQENGAWLLVRYAGAKGSYEGWILREYVVLNAMTIILRSSNTAVYAAPSQASPKVGSLPCYTALPVIGMWGDFYIVSLRSASGFIHMSANVWTDWDMANYDQAMGVTLRVKKDTALRTGPGTSWDGPEKIRAGTTIEALTFYPENGWYVVRYKDIFIAYINAQDVDVIGNPNGNG